MAETEKTRRCGCGCGAPLPPPNSAAGRPREFLTDAHRKRAARAAARRKRGSAAARRVRDRYGVAPERRAPSRPYAGPSGTAVALAEELRRAGATDAEVAAVLGCRPEELPAPGDGGAEDAGTALLGADPLSVAAAVLRRTQLVWRLAAEAAAQEAGSSRIGALRLMLEADGKAVDLLQALGRLPRDLGALRGLADLQAVARDLLSAVDALERGTASPADVRRTLLRHAALPSLPADLEAEPGPEAPPGEPAGQRDAA